MSKHLSKHHAMSPPEKKPRIQDSKTEKNEVSVSITKEEQDIIDSRLYVHCSIFCTMKYIKRIYFNIKEPSLSLLAIAHCLWWKMKILLILFHLLIQSTSYLVEIHYVILFYRRLRVLKKRYPFHLFL